MLGDHVESRLPFENQNGAKLNFNYWVRNRALNLRSVGESVEGFFSGSEPDWLDDAHLQTKQPLSQHDEQHTLLFVTVYGASPDFIKQNFVNTSFAQQCSTVPTIAVSKDLKETPKPNQTSSNPNTWFYNDVKTIESELLWPVLPSISTDKVSTPLLSRHFLQSFQWIIEIEIISKISEVMEDGSLQQGNDISAQIELLFIRPTHSASTAEEFQIVQTAVMEKISTTATFQQLKELYQMEVGYYLSGKIQQGDGIARGYIFAGVNQQDEIKILVIVWNDGAVDLLELQPSYNDHSTLHDISFLSRPLSGDDYKANQLSLRMMSLLPRFYGGLDVDISPPATTNNTTDTTAIEEGEPESNIAHTNDIPTINMQQHLDELRRLYLEIKQEENANPFEPLVLSIPILDMLGYTLEEVAMPGFICTKDVNWNQLHGKEDGGMKPLSGQKHKFFAELEDGEEEEEEEREENIAESTSNALRGRVDTILEKISAQAIHFQRNEQLWPFDLLSIDCEMCCTVNGMELTRVTLLHPLHGVVLDTIVRPGKEIVEYFSEFSGITADQMTNITITLGDIHYLLQKMIDKDTILVGHSFDNDLKVLRLFHHRVIDTAALFPHPSSLPYKHSLKKLAKDILNLDIQDGSGGHDSIQDALATILLVIKKIQLLGDSTETFHQQQLRNLPHPNYNQASNNSGNNEPRYSLFQQLSDRLGSTHGLTAKVYSNLPYIHRPSYERDAFGYRLDMEALHALRKVDESTGKSVQSTVFESKTWQQLLQQVDGDLQNDSNGQIDKQQLIWVSIHLNNVNKVNDEEDDNQPSKKPRVENNNGTTSPLTLAEELSHYLDNIYRHLPRRSRMFVLPQKDVITLRSMIARKTRRKWDFNNSVKKKQKVAFPPGYKPSNDWDGQKDEAKLLEEANQVALCNLFLRFKS